MKNLIRYIVIHIALVGAIFAQEKVANPLPETDYKKAFLQLIYDKAVKYSEAGEMAVEKSVDFVIKEAEPTFKEYIVWSIIGHLWDGVPWIIAFSGGILTIIIFWKSAKWPNEEPPNIQCIIIFLGLMFSVGGFFGTFVGSPRPTSTTAITDVKLATQAYFAPRVYVINNVSNYIKELNKK